jgi:hypothetical protein
MGSLVPIQTQVETKNGEVLVTINLNLNIKLDSEGKLLSLDAEAKAAPQKKQEENPSDVSKVRFEKPDIEDNSDIIPFGRQV